MVITPETGWLLDINNSIWEWGSTSSNDTITLPVSFSNNGYGVALCNSFTANNYVGLTIKNGTKTVSKFAVMAVSTTANLSTYWIAIGH